MKRGQKGFTVVETLLVLILFAILGFTGYYVYHSRNNANATYNNAANTSSSTPKQSASTSKANTTAAEKVVTDFYNAYIQATKDNLSANNSQATTDTVNKYGTQNFINNYPKIQAQGYDPVFCAQNTVESIAILNSSVISSNNVVVNISRQGYSDTSSNHPSVSVIGSKIDSIACPNI